VKKRAIIIAVVSPLALAFVPFPSRVTPTATVHVFDERRMPVAGVTVYRSWEHFGLHRDGHQNSQTSKSGEVTSSADNAVATDFGGVLRRNGNSDGIFVDVQADIMHDFIHGCLVSLLCCQRPSLKPGL
jgi:hypothetical protein